MSPPRGARGWPARWIASLGGIRGRIIVLLMAAGIPVTSIAITNAWKDYQGALDEGRRGVSTFRAVVEAQYGAVLGPSEGLIRSIAVLAPLVTQPAADAPPDCGPLLRRALELRPGEFSNLWVLDAGQGLLCSALPVGGKADGEAAYVRRAFVQRAPSFGPFLRGTATNDVVLPLAVPVLNGDRAVRVVVATLLLEHFAAVALPGAGGQHVWLVDGEGMSLPTAGTAAPLAAPADLLARIAQGPRAPPPEAADGEVAYSAGLLRPGLGLVVGQPMGAIHAAAQSLLVQRMAELAAFLLLCLAAIVVGADLAMARPLRSLAARVRNWRPGSPFPVSPSSTEPREVRELERAFSDAAGALSRREGDLRAALGQRDALMAEIHHRVKNNLQIVSSLLNLQASRIGDSVAAEEFLAARNRVRALATLHRHLYMQQSFERVSLRPFLEELATQQFQSYGEVPGERIALRLDLADIVISTDQAVSLALLVTEAVGNAVEHAFPDDRNGTVRLTVHREGDEVVIQIGDDGVGLPEARQRPRGLGLTLLEGFARQLGGKLVGGAGEGGTNWTVRFPLRENQEPRAMAAGAPE